MAVRGQLLRLSLNRSIPRKDVWTNIERPTKTNWLSALEFRKVIDTVVEMPGIMMQLA